MDSVHKENGGIHTSTIDTHKQLTFIVYIVLSIVHTCVYVEVRHC